MSPHKSKIYKLSRSNITLNQRILVKRQIFECSSKPYDGLTYQTSQSIEHRIELMLLTKFIKNISNL